MILPGASPRGSALLRRPALSAAFLTSFITVLFWIGSAPSGAQPLGEDSPRPRSETCEAEQAAAWIAGNFADAPVRAGVFQGRLELESPAVLQRAEITQARYGVSLLEREPPMDPRAALVDVSISNLRSANRFGGGIKTHAGSPGMKLFLVDVVIDPHWPDWLSYESTNYDGIILDAAAAIYAQNLTIRNWNADSAIDNKAQVSQFVNLSISGPGHRPIRYWKPGPHYLVDAKISREGDGTLLWVRDCNDTTIYVYNSTFNGEPSIPETGIQCEAGDTPEIVYLREDPVIKGEMHPMFQRCPAE